MPYFLYRMFLLLFLRLSGSRCAALSCTLRCDAFTIIIGPHGDPCTATPLVASPLHMTEPECVCDVVSGCLTWCLFKNSERQQQWADLWDEILGNTEKDLLVKRSLTKVLLTEGKWKQINSVKAAVCVWVRACNSACVTHDTGQNGFLRPDDTGQEIGISEYSGDLLAWPRTRLPAPALHPPAVAGLGLWWASCGTQFWPREDHSAALSCWDLVRGAPDAYWV